MSTLTGNLFKLIVKSSYLCSDISFSDSDVNIHIEKAQIAISRSSIIRNSDLI